MPHHLITAALPYANGPVHIGHLAGAYLPADVYVRYLRAMGEDVVFICGSDEHGVPITLRARKEGVSPQQVVDKYHGIIRQSFADFGISFDIYDRTSSPIHHETASDFFKTLFGKGEFTEESSEQYYDEEAGLFLADRYITGTCPNCGNTNAYGDQCEKCGKSLSPRELINPHSQLSGKPPVLRQTKHWYLPLDRYQREWLEKWIDGHRDDWKPNVFGQCKSWLDQGLQPRAVTRDLDWGVPVPLPDSKGKVLYVWFDAPIGYISATKALFRQRGDANGWEKYWKSKDARLVHFIGKDNIVFHCIIFPAMLHAHGGYVLPENVPANEFLNLEGDKISTSRNWAVWLHEYLQDFPGKQDVLRYALCATAPETKDNDFTWKDFQARNNSELVAILGNFVNRTLVLTAKYYNGKVPAAHALSDEDRACLEAIQAAPGKLGDLIRRYKFREALFELMNLARLGNKYLADNEPWKKQATDPQRVETILHVSLRITAALARLMEPFLPFTSEKLHGMLNLVHAKWTAAWDETLLPVGHQLGEAGLLFEKIEDPAIETQVARLQASKAANEAASAAAPAVSPQKAPTSFDDFQKMDIRIGTILAAERVPKTEKLLKLTVDTGIDQRTVVSGIAAHYDPEKIVGQQVTILVNLEPRKIKGIESQGMILMAENAKGELAFLQPTKAVENGGTIS
ncbi:MAG: methionine--tRNA ligase [Bacteroidia bacterium]|uniref:methionine--tRNA ligase n=1 Tax=Candidatus Pollutiaquabacter sp. TaxID=3416354 RepID=UPI001A536887|nr:methionine--tRNA ligase [Bacteroidota bacterium]MBL7948862.1 methionine--tRNA ligase [Bacteroidia bacterium]